ncbi:heme ABC transporter ATP-binding protein [Flectobacillus major]|uniref:heme ABC transporter ATP-binding protein n=1 Tax=Flectobacillus major TaxID=103 RepID=UPI00041A3926|nr:heme ABC transporter ATP-binding protein [Flectobacillus major]
MIQAQNIHYTIRGRTLLRGVSLEAQTGELLAIVGANGAGKSTLLRLLSKELLPHQGNIQIRQRSLDCWTRESLARFRAVLAQQNTLAFNFNVYDLVIMGRYPHFKGNPSVYDHEIVQYCLQKTGVSHLSERIFMTLSGGEQQRVFLAKVMAQLLDYEAILDENYVSKAPKYLLLDEPITGLDLYHQHNLLQIAKELTQKGFCVIAILHDLNLALQYADQVLLLKQGEVLGYGKPVDVLSPHNVLEAFNIAVNLIHQPDMACPFIVHCQEPISNKKTEICQPQHFH